jgi:F0F1-type ATP synthase delta subunit
MKLNSAIKEDLKKRLMDDIEKQKEKVFITSSYHLSEPDKEILYTKMPEIKNREIEYLVDNKLIAGIKIQIGSRVIDLTLLNLLQNLQFSLYEIN